jgi:hypothetical protein
MLRDSFGSLFVLLALANPAPRVHYIHYSRSLNFMPGHYEQIAMNAVEEGGLCSDCPIALKALRRATRADIRNPEAQQKEGVTDLLEDMITMGTIGAATMLKKSPCDAEQGSGICEPDLRFRDVTLQIMEASTPEESTVIAQENGINVRFTD